MDHEAAQGRVEQGSWLTLSEAAERSGLHKEALRARAKRKQLPSQRNNLGQILVMLPPDLLTLAQGAAQGVAQGIAHGQVEQLVELVRDLEQELAEVRANAQADLAKAVAERDAAREVAEARVAAAERLVAELQAMLAEARRPWWRRWVGK
jgi:DNA-binding transcriptional MerR regulator